jgi:tRNA (cytidine56-2'-O)-methyltransferase
LNRRKIWVLRLNHRSKRDKRVTTHLLLAARAFGADGTFYSGERDENVEGSVGKVNKSWGGTFKVEFTHDWRQVIKEWKHGGGEVVHLTMYGLPVQDAIGQLRASPKNKLVIVGGAKVPGVIYELADWNISVTSQPHSEVSALSVFLHELFEGKELDKRFLNAEERIVPQAKSKKIVKTNPKP